MRPNLNDATLPTTTNVNCLRLHISFISEGNDERTEYIGRIVLHFIAKNRNREKSNEKCFTSQNVYILTDTECDPYVCLRA